MELYNDMFKDINIDDLSLLIDDIIIKHNKQIYTKQKLQSIC